MDKYSELLRAEAEDNEVIKAYERGEITIEQYEDLMQRNGWL